MMGFHNYHHVPLSVMSCISYVVLLVFLCYMNIVCFRRGWFIIIAIITFSVTWGFIGSDSEHTMET